MGASAPVAQFLGRGVGELHMRVPRCMADRDGLSKEQEEKLALLLSKAGLQHHFDAFVREKVCIIFSYTLAR